MEKVSIYIPAYNAEKTIKDSIDSLYKQSILFDEIIVINDCSNDKTNEILKIFSGIKIFNNKENKGLGYCRNLAMSKAQNQIVASIDADVVLASNWLEIILDELKSNNVHMCGGKLVEKYIENDCNSWRAFRYSQNWGDENLKDPPFLYGCNSIQYKFLWNMVGGYNDKLQTNGEDIDYSEKIRSLKKNIFYSSKAICHHLQNDNYTSLSKRVWRYHSFGYKIKKPSTFRLIKLIIKQFNFFIKRTIKDIINLKFSYLIINFIVLFYFIIYEVNRTYNE